MIKGKYLNTLDWQLKCGNTVVAHAKKLITTGTGQTNIAVRTPAKIPCTLPSWVGVIYPWESTAPFLSRVGYWSSSDVPKSLVVSSSTLQTRDTESLAKVEFLEEPTPALDEFEEHQQEQVTYDGEAEEEVQEQVELVPVPTQREADEALTEDEIQEGEEEMAFEEVNLIAGPQFEEVMAEEEPIEIEYEGQEPIDHTVSSFPGELDEDWEQNNLPYVEGVDYADIEGDADEEDEGQPETKELEEEEEEEEDEEQYEEQDEDQDEDQDEGEGQEEEKGVTENDQDEEVLEEEEEEGSELSFEEALTAALSSSRREQEGEEEGEVGTSEVEEHEGEYDGEDFETWPSFVEEKEVEQN